jgi:PAS domain S-box-containing protein
MSDTIIENKLRLANRELNMGLATQEETLLKMEMTGEALQESEKRYRRLFESAKDGILILDADKGTVVDANPFLLQLLGYSYDALYGQHIWDLGVFKDIAASKDAFKILQDNEYIRYDDLPLKTLDGKPIAVEFVSNVYLVDHSKVIQCNIRDITAHKRAEEALRESEERHRRIVETSSDAFLLHSREIVIYANPAALKLFRANQPGDLIGKRYLDLIHPDDRALSAELMKKSIVENWIATPREHRILALDGQVVHVESSGGVVNCRGETQIFRVFRDITARKRVDQEKEKLKDHLRQAQKMEAIGTLAGGIAHDFNNILSVIVGNAEILGLTNAVDDSSRGNLNQILAASQRAKQLVSQILAFSRLGKLERGLIDLKPIVKETLEFLRSSLPSSIQLRHDPEPACGAIMGDPTQIQQILINLGTNAAHAMETEGGILQISLANTAVTEGDAHFDPEVDPGNFVKITVSDTGHGMEPSVRQRIFDPYFTTKEPGKGTGLGLSVVYGIVKAHGGMIKVYSEVGKGTSFTILLPRAKGFEKVADTPSQPLARGTEKILFVDDEKALTDLGQQMLGWLGYQVQVRTSPIEALEAFRANPQKFDLVITDMTMPQMNGLKLARHLIEIRPDIPVILCTGFSEQVNEQASGAMGIRAFLYKPLVMRDIAEAVRKALDSNMPDMQ